LSEIHLRRFSKRYEGIAEPLDDLVASTIKKQFAEDRMHFKGGIFHLPSPFLSLDRLHCMVHNFPYVNPDWKRTPGGHHLGTRLRVVTCVNQFSEEPH
jgi:hypothetical protein